MSTTVTGNVGLRLRDLVPQRPGLGLAASPTRDPRKSAAGLPLVSDVVSTKVANLVALRVDTGPGFNASPLRCPLRQYTAPTRRQTGHRSIANPRWWLIKGSCPPLISTMRWAPSDILEVSSRIRGGVALRQCFLEVRLAVFHALCKLAGHQTGHCRPEKCLRPLHELFPTSLTVRLRPPTVALGSLHPARTPPPWHDRLRIAQCASWNVPQTNVNVPNGLKLVAIDLRREHASTRTELNRLDCRSVVSFETLQIPLQSFHFGLCGLDYRLWRGRVRI